MMSAQATESQKIKAIAFDALAIFDPSPLWAEAEKQFPGQGMELAAVWRSRLFEYQWLRAAGDHYANFEKVAEDALVFAAKSQNLTLTTEKRKALLAPLLQLKAFPDAKPALQSLKAAGYRLAFLSNMTPAMLAAGIQNSRLEGLFEESLSTDRLRTYKPDSKAYQLGVDALHVKREEILFVPSAAWDLTGARWFGYPTFWVNRSGAPDEELDMSPQESGKNLSDLVLFASQTPLPSTAVSTMPSVNESDLVTLFRHMKYKTRLHLSMLNGDEIDGTFSSFDPSREIIFVNPAGSSGMFGKKVYALQKMKTVSQLP